MKRPIVLAALLGAVAALLGASTLSADNAWGNYHWARTSNPFTLKVYDNVSSAWDTYLAQAANDWSASNVLDLSLQANSPLSNAKKCSSAKGVIEVCSSRYGYNGWLGIAGITVSGSHITKAYTKLNDSYFETSTYNTPAWRELVVCQEIGHDFGLDHQDETFDNANLGTCMDYTNDPDGGAGGASASDPANTAPNQHDFDELEAIYAHLDSTTTVGSAAPTGPGRGNGNGAAASAAALDEHGLPPWASPRNGDVYVTDLGNGQRLIVHVFWIPPGLPGARSD